MITLVKDIQKHEKQKLYKKTKNTPLFYSGNFQNREKMKIIEKIDIQKGA